MAFPFLPLIFSGLKVLFKNAANEGREILFEMAVIDVCMRLAWEGASAHLVDHA